jgi:16S rRNA A1518/A1519 N6-dimethyltransferase RsmA/KsgA/DIM1 with predicted DNA glycosylase/AP lyase activity
MRRHSRRALRKTLAQRPGASAVVVQRVLAATGASPDARPQELALPQFLALFHELHPQAAEGAPPTPPETQAAAAAQEVA